MAETQATEAPGMGANGPGVRREVLIVLPGLLLAIMLAMLDQLVVSTALPRIVGVAGVVRASTVIALATPVPYRVLPLVRAVAQQG